ncbi:MAG: translation initiation factor [Phycisphaerales bacterium]|nr:translation initiation factor [Phycisphaerales bacterium]
MSGLFTGTPWERPVTCEVCHRPRASCACPRNAMGTHCPPAQQAARVRRERRRGKMVTIVTGLDPVASNLQALLRELRTLCAAGGTVTEGTIEVQGDHRDRIIALLHERGYPARAAGG